VKTTTVEASTSPALRKYSVDVLTQALEEDDLSSERLSIYDERWRALLSKEIEAGLRLRRFARYLSDEAVAP
jgi:flavin-dependent dehydrogenase